VRGVRGGVLGGGGGCGGRVRGVRGGGRGLEKNGHSIGDRMKRKQKRHGTRTRGHPMDMSRSFLGIICCPLRHISTPKTCVM
jgi:hypothetical protein